MQVIEFVSHTPFFQQKKPGKFGGASLKHVKEQVQMSVSTASPSTEF